MSKLRQIIALGGGGFSMEPQNQLLDLYILKQAGKEKPNVCFIGTASGDAQGYIDRFYTAFKKFDCIPSHLSLFRGHTSEIEKFVLDQDILYVGGGNTRNLLTLWKDWGLDAAIRKAYENGTVLAGISAGSICWFEQGVTDSVPGRLSSLKCLGWLQGSNCPHYDGEAERRPSYHHLLKAGEIAPGVATEDGVAAHFINEELKGFVSSHPEKKAYTLSLKLGEPVEEVHSPKYLGGQTIFIRRAAVQDAESIHRAHMKSIQEICSKDHSQQEVQAWGHRPYREEDELDSQSLIARAEKIQAIIQERDPVTLKNAYKALFAAIEVGELDKNGRRELRFRIKGSEDFALVGNRAEQFGIELKMAHQSWPNTTICAAKKISMISMYQSTPLYQNKDFLRHLYLEKRLSTHQISREIRSARSTVKEALGRFGIPLRSEDEAHRLNKGQLGYGERMVNGRIVPHKAEMEIISQIAALRADGLSYGQIVEWLNKRGIKTKNRAKSWDRPTVYKILRSWTCCDKARPAERFQLH